jgi:hypothetical protein
MDCINGHTACFADEYNARVGAGYKADALLVITSVPAFDSFFRKKCIAR